MTSIVDSTSGPCGYAWLFSSTQEWIRVLLRLTQNTLTVSGPSEDIFPTIACYLPETTIIETSLTLRQFGVKRHSIGFILRRCCNRAGDDAAATHHHLQSQQHNDDDSPRGVTEIRTATCDLSHSQHRATSSSSSASSSTDNLTLAISSTTTTANKTTTARSFNNSNDVCIAADDEESHATWMKVISSLTGGILTHKQTNSVLPVHRRHHLHDIVDGNDDNQRKEPTNENTLPPSRITTTTTTACHSIVHLPSALATWLSSPTDCVAAAAAQHLVTRLHAARTSIERAALGHRPSIRSSRSTSSTDPLHAVHTSLNDLEECLVQLSRGIDVAAAKGWTSSAADIQEAQEWIQSMVECITTCTTAAYEAQFTPSSSVGVGIGGTTASSWAVVGVETAAALHAVENALQIEIAKEKRAHVVQTRNQQQGKQDDDGCTNKIGGGVNGRMEALASAVGDAGGRKYARRSAQGYFKYWAKRVAV